MAKDPPANAGDLRDAGLISGSGRERWPADRRRPRCQGETRILFHTLGFFWPTHISHMSCMGRWILHHWTTGLSRSISFAYNFWKENNQLISVTLRVSDLIFWASQWERKRERKTMFSIIQVALVVKNPKCRGHNHGVANSPPQMGLAYTHTHLKINPSMILSQSTGHSITID